MTVLSLLVLKRHQVGGRSAFFWILWRQAWVAEEGIRSSDE